jgi:hypothetical protein
MPLRIALARFSPAAREAMAKTAARVATVAMAAMEAGEEMVAKEGRAAARRAAASIWLVVRSSSPLRI